MILGALGMIAANAATLLGARALLDRVKTGTPSADFVLFLLLRFLLISAAVILAGLAHALTPWVLGLAGAVALGLLCARGAHRSLPRPTSLPWNRWLVGFAALILLRLLLQVWFFAPYSEDVLSYHLPKIAEWLRAGAFTREMGNDPRVTLPAGFELIETWWVVFLHHDVLIEMAGLEFLLLAAASVYALARRLDWSPSCAFGAALLMALTPGLHLQATSTMNDVAAAAMILATTALLFAAAAPSLILLAVGLGAGVKPTYVYALPGLALLFWMLRREARPAPGSRRAAFTLAGLALAAGAFWYLRNLVWFGNPVYPMGTPRGNQVQQLGPSLASLKENLLALVDLRVYDFVSAPGALHAGNANWGAAAFACGFPALIVLLREEPRLRRLALAFLVSLLSLLTLITLDRWNSRFVLFVPALAALALSQLASRHRVLAGLAAAALLMETYSTSLPSELPRPKASMLAAQDWKERSLRPLPALLRDQSTIGFHGDLSGGPYLLYGADYSHRVLYLRDESLPLLLASLDREGVRFFYVAQKPDARKPLFQEGVEHGMLRPFEDGERAGFERIR